MPVKIFAAEGGRWSKNAKPHCMVSCVDSDILRLGKAVWFMGTWGVKLRRRVAASPQSCKIILPRLKPAPYIIGVSITPHVSLRIAPCPASIIKFLTALHKYFQPLLFFCP